jgi:hypothetical protein
MSAYIVDHDHIDALLTYAIQQEVTYYVPDTKSCVEISAKNASEIGRILLDQNERSVRFRYPNIDADDLPGTIGQDAAKYKFRRWKSPLPALVVLKACDGLDYQSCETDDYKQTLAFKIVDTIRGYAIRRLPGYDASPGWSMERVTA